MEETMVQHAHDIHADSGSQDEWNKIAHGYDQTNTPTQMWLGNEGLRRTNIQAGDRFLDVACGSGALSIPAARLGAEVFAVDQSPAMLELLGIRAHQENLDIKTLVMDGHVLEFNDNTFDIAGSQFGVMLFPDMPKGIREMARVVRKGGRVLLNVYGDPHKIEFFGFFVGAIQSVRPEFTGPPMDPVPLPFQLQNPERLNDELVGAGLKDVTVETITESTEFSSGNNLWEWIIWSNPIVEEVLGSLELVPQERTIIQRTLDEMVQKRSGGNGPAKLTNPVHIGYGVK